MAGVDYNPQRLRRLYFKAVSEKRTRIHVKDTNCSPARARFEVRRYA
ncbi:MAG TPA: hypothetical protein VG324_04710 [Blastocatellia bacterium]|nr:hypothetical protein [Blastocatellia bacterium]